MDSASPQPLESTFAYKAPDDYKINQCFTQTLFIEKDSDRFANHTRIMLDSNFKPLSFQFSAENLPITTIPPIKPPTFAMMLRIAQSLAAPINYVRIDLYECNNAIYVGELTFTPAGGTSSFNPQKWDKFYGEKWA
ncbi:ATP-grasp fold amidoligase family protein [uncultured Helicobacter sp.]|uniref:ATP-grasp fold amidoligase family protein n=1 Tax=uncultured Helicobacter sp. TaxID=175537 RepID=UPI00263337C0|nr:ATP-grasp fold amidoligase family protein [uncultured Helicobacter sp.]